MRKITLLFILILTFGFNFSSKAQSQFNRQQFYEDYKKAVEDKMAIIKTNSDLYQKALKSGWFNQIELGLKNAETFKDGNNLVSTGNFKSGGGATCETKDPFCTAAGSTYPAGVNTGTAQSGPAYGCLSSQPNPVWYYMKVAVAGDIHITETNSANVDVDFILWGPFSNLDVCGSLTSAKIIDCSYSPVAVEYIDISSSQVGEYYILLVTNFSNTATNITLAKTSGSGETDCNILIPDPAVSTTSITAITSNSASSGGNITNDSGLPIIARGVCWNSTGNPTISDSHTTDGTGMGTFTSSITGLTPGVTYYVRAYATNSNSTGYGQLETFTTLSFPVLTTTTVTSILGYTASSGGNIIDDSGAAVSERGVCWNTSGNPTISDPRTSDGSGTGSFTSSITGLMPGTTYYVRSYATNANGTGYGQQVSFSTPPDPILSTTNVSSIFTKRATSGGEVISEGMSAVTARGVCWNTGGTPTTANSKTVDGTGLGTFSSSLTGLTGSTLYYVRAYVTNAQGTFYGNQVSFTTQPPTKANNDSYTLTEDDPATSLKIQANDYYCLDGPVTTPIKLITNPVHGATSINNNGTPTDLKDDYIVYTPIANHHGTDSFIYEICDFYSECFRATASFTITSVDDFPNAQNSDFTLLQAIYGNRLNILTPSDFGGDVPFDGPGSWSIVNYPTYGTLAINNNGTPAVPTDDYVTYSPTNCYAGPDMFVYKVCDPDGDCSTATVNLMIEVDLFNISKGFSPNGDGINDKFIIGDLTLYPNNSLTIINRWGNKVFEAKPYNNDWDGTAQMGVRLGGDEVPQGTYFFLFDPGNNTGVRKGHFYIKRK